MKFAGVNYLAVVVAAAASFLFGGVWYGLLAQPWLRALGRSEADLKSPDGSMPALFAVTFVAQLIMAGVLAGIIGHFGAGQVTIRNGLISGAFVWMGFVATALIVNNGYQGNRWTLTAIDGGHWLGVLLIQGMVIGMMGVD